MAGLDGGRIGMASQAVGLAESCIAESVEYSTQRVQFGKPVNGRQEYYKRSGDGEVLCIGDSG